MSLNLPAGVNRVLGAGYLYFDEYDANNDLTGEELIADTPNFAFNVSTERVTESDADGKIAETILDVPVSIDRSGTFETKNMSDTNIARFIIGDLRAETTAVGAVVAEEINGDRPITKQGVYFQLGATNARPTGVLGVNAAGIVVRSEVANPPTVVRASPADYIVEENNGRLYIVPGGAIAVGHNVEIDYSTTVYDWNVIDGSQSGAKEGLLRYIGCNTEGTNYTVVIPRVRLNPNGDFNLKSRSESSTLSFQFLIQKPFNGEKQVYVFENPDA